jgi:hypothetical protein
MDIKAIVFVVLFFLLIMISNFLLHKVSRGDYLKLMNWSIVLYLFLIPASLVSCILLESKSGIIFNDSKEYVFVFINIFVLIMIAVFRLLFNWLRNRLENQQSKILTTITLFSIVLPIFNIMYFISRYQEILK